MKKEKRIKALTDIPEGLLDAAYLVRLYSGRLSNSNALYSGFVLTVLWRPGNSLEKPSGR